MAEDDELEQQYTRMAEEQQAREHVVRLGYDERELEALPAEAVVSFGCGNPLAVAELRPGDIVLDLGSGVGLDALLAARQVGPSGHVIGLDATPAMAAKARANAAAGGFHNVGFVVGAIEAPPLREASVDVALSNCVLNHCADMGAAFRAVWHCLRAGGRALITDLMFEGACTETLLAQVDPIWHEWLHRASPRAAYLAALEGAGFAVEVLGEADYPAAESDPLAGQITNVYVRATRVG